MRIILASGSPRRRELLALMGLEFCVIPADINEAMDPAKPPYDEVARVSTLKARAIPREPGDAVIAADTVVVLDGKVLGKPHTPQRAREMLRALSGREHQVMTGCTVLFGEQEERFTQVTHLRFRELGDVEIDRYVATGEPLDKAGAYGIQGGAAIFCEEIAGDYYNVMGLPVCRLYEVLRRLGILEEGV